MDDTYLDAHGSVAIVCQTQNPMHGAVERADGEERERRRISEQMTALLKWQWASHRP